MPKTPTDIRVSPSPEGVGISEGTGTSEGTGISEGRTVSSDAGWMPQLGKSSRFH